MKRIIVLLLVFNAANLNIFSQVDPCYVLTEVLREVDKAVVQGKYDDALQMLEKVKSDPRNKQCPEMKDGVVDYKINDVREKMGTRKISHFCPDNNHPHAIDLGLPSGTKWACCNIGARTPDSYGNFYAWGETSVKKDYSWSTYTGGLNGKNDDVSITICNTKYDVAHLMWGGTWLMPRVDECAELKDNCLFTSYSMNGIDGVKVTSKKNGKSIFMPAAGFRDGTEHKKSGYSGFFWSSDKKISVFNKAGVLFFHGEEAGVDLYFERCYGISVRPVKDSNKPFSTSNQVLSWNQFVDKILLLQKYGLYSNGKEINQHSPSDNNKNEAIIFKNGKMFWTNSGDGDREYSYNINSNVLNYSNTKEKGWIKLERKDKDAIFTIDNKNTYRYFEVYIICPWCKGDCHTECPTCEGTGNATDDHMPEGCSTCNGLGVVDCFKCKGEGVIKY